MVFAELAGGIAERLEELGDRRIFRLQTEFSSRQPYLGQAGADRRLAGDECGAARGATLLAVPIREQRAFLGHAVDVGRAVAHKAVIVSADVEPADVVSPDNQGCSASSAFR